MAASSRPAPIASRTGADDEPSAAGSASTANRRREEPRARLELRIADDLNARCAERRADAAARVAAIRPWAALIRAAGHGGRFQGHARTDLGRAVPHGAGLAERGDGADADSAAICATARGVTVVGWIVDALAGTWTG